jgi:hypothetical protein
MRSSSQPAEVQLAGAPQPVSRVWGAPHLDNVVPWLLCTRRHAPSSSCLNVGSQHDSMLHPDCGPHYPPGVVFLRPAPSVSIANALLPSWHRQVRRAHGWLVTSQARRLLRGPVARSCGYRLASER